MSNPSAPPSYGVAVEDKRFGGQPYPPQYGTQYGNPPPAGTPYPPQPGPGYPPATGYAPYPQGGPPQPQPYVYQPEPPVSKPTAHRYDANTGAVYSAPVGHSADIDSAEAGGFSTGGSFSDKNVRRMFIRKVFIVLGLQLLVTFGIVALFTTVDSVRTWVRANPICYWASYAVFLVLYFALICVESLRRKTPHNLITLGIFTLALSYMTGTIAAYYKTQAVMVTMGVTVVVCLGIILFSMQTRFDFTKCAGVLFVLSMVLFLFGLITIFTYSRSWYVQVVYGALGALVFGLFLAFDVQLVMGGRKYELDPEEYVFGALNLYIDVVYIFLFLLSIFGGSSN